MSYSLIKAATIKKIKVNNITIAALPISIQTYFDEILMALLHMQVNFTPELSVSLLIALIESTNLGTKCITRQYKTVK